MTQSQIDRLQELKKLLDAGILSKEEMQVEKSKILSESQNPVPEALEDNQESALEVEYAEPQQVSNVKQEGFEKLHIFIILSIIVIIAVSVLIFCYDSKDKKSTRSDRYDYERYEDEYDDYNKASEQVEPIDDYGGDYRDDYGGGYEGTYDGGYDFGSYDYDDEPNNNYDSDYEYSY